MSSDKIVFTNGCFDILHRGHIELLRLCKSLGKVVVGLNSDDSVRALKGQARPVNTQEDRKYILEACRFVDKVVIFDEETPYELIEKISPDIVVKGGDYKVEDVVAGETATVVIFNYIDGYSTTKTIKDITNR
jgi:D-beta-D-heptose 7-phosphate kinase/D-beta-D-heptose 1-phosphate adenosyltransferase